MAPVRRTKVMSTHASNYKVTTYFFIKFLKLFLLKIILIGILNKNLFIPHMQQSLLPLDGETDVFDIKH